jgi:hypothetical protein
MNPMLQQFTAVALPIILALAGAAWVQNRRLDDIIARLARIEAKLDDHQDRILRLEERTSPVRR